MEGDIIMISAEVLAHEKELEEKKILMLKYADQVEKLEQNK